MKNFPQAEPPKLVQAEIIIAVTIFGEHKLPGEIVEVDETSFRNLERKGRLKLYQEPVEQKPDPPRIGNLAKAG